MATGTALSRSSCPRCLATLARELEESHCASPSSQLDQGAVANLQVQLSPGFRCPFRVAFDIISIIGVSQDCRSGVRTRPTNPGP